MTALTIHRVTALPGTLVASSLYIVQGTDSDQAELYFTGNDSAEVRHVVTKPEVAAMIAAAGGGSGGAATSLATPRNINGVAFDGTADIVINAVDSTARVASSLLGVADGVATLDSSGLIPSSQLPSYVDDVLEFADLASMPASGESGKIYIALDTDKVYRWTGTVYIEISAAMATADTAGSLTTARTISASGDVVWSVSFDGSGNVTSAAVLADSGVTAGAYPKVTVNSKGLVTAGSALVAADIPSLDYTTVSSAASVNLPTSEW